MAANDYHSLRVSIDSLHSQNRGITYTAEFAKESDVMPEDGGQRGVSTGNGLTEIEIEVQRIREETLRR